MYQVYKETAFVHALTAAALTYQISRACAEGTMTRCQCANERRPATKQFRWGGCSDNVKHGKRVARNFLELQSSDGVEDESTVMLRHDSEVGIMTVTGSLGEKCKCHGELSQEKLKLSYTDSSAFFQVFRAVVPCRLAGES